MPADVSALFTVSVYVEAMLGLLLLFTWVQNTDIKAVAWWGSAHLLRAGSITLFGMFGGLPNAITIDLANAILLTSFAVTWTGTRLFRGQDVNYIFVFEGAFIWLVACRMPEIAGSVALRAVLSAAIIATYTWLAAAEIWRNSEGHLVSRIPASFMLFAHGALFLLRTPLAVLMPHPPGTEPIFGSVWLTVLSSEALLFTIAIAFVVMAMAKERTAYVHKTAALIDPLTGIWNRRGFMVESDRLMEASGKKSDHAAMLFIDLDNFKTINDRYGHALGDQVLQILAAAVNTVIRSSDFVSRLGGEEFAVVLHGAPRDSALAIAERIRSAFAERAAVIDGVHVAATVSIGLVLHEGPPVAFSELLWKADQALYRAKERGRNRVELLGPDYFAGGNENNLSGRAMAPAVRSVA
jgi:diguanylate cyclase (GGDEF)-like protein